MRSNDWHAHITAQMHLPPDDAQRLRSAGFVVMPAAIVGTACAELSRAYDHAVATADPVDVRIGSKSIRIDDFVNRGPQFDPIYIHPWVLAACLQIIAGPFKLSGMRARTVVPGAQMEGLHVDVEHRADGWPLVGCIVMIDAFAADNGATRFVPGTHLQTLEAGEIVDPNEPHPEQELACGPAGSIILFNASVWHSHTANCSAQPRRSIQAHFVPRSARASVNQAERIHRETYERIGGLARYVLDVTEVCDFPGV